MTRLPRAVARVLEPSGINKAMALRAMRESWSLSVERLRQGDNELRQGG